MADEIRPDVENAGRECAPNALQAPNEAQLRRDARRRILVGGLAGAPLVLTLSSRSAFASHCSPSGTSSGNMSRHDEAVCVGMPPEFWRTNVEYVSQYVDPGTCNPITDDGIECDYSVPTIEDLEAYIEELREQDEVGNAQKIAAAEEYLENLRTTYPDPEFYFGTRFSTIFQIVYTDAPNVTIMQALSADVEGSSPVLSHSAAAWLNANEFGPEAYGLSPAKVIELVQDQLLMSPVELLATLQALNARGE